MDLYQKINAIMKDVKTLKKDGNIAFGKTQYSYLSESKTTQIFHELFATHGLALLPISSKSNITRYETIKTTEYKGEKKEDKKVEYLTESEFTYRLVNTDNPLEYIDIQTSGQGLDTGDKGGGKASSYAYKYLLWRTFAIPSNDDPDKISSDELREQIDGKEPPLKNTPQDNAPDNNEYTPPIPPETDYKSLLDGESALICSVCKTTISQKVHDYSMDRYNKSLCMKHQKGA